MDDFDLIPRSDLDFLTQSSRTASAIGKVRNFLKSKIMTGAQDKIDINKNEWKSGAFWAKHTFTHLGLFILVSGYCAGGAYLFQYIEYDTYEKLAQSIRDQSTDIDAQRVRLAENFWKYKNQVGFKDTVKALLTDYQNNVSNLISNSLQGSIEKYDGNPLTKTNYKNVWEFWTALLFAITIVTTIGYGNAPPTTSTGQMTVIFYALVGVPLMVMFLANIGDAMATFFRFAYGRGCCYFCHRKRKQNYQANQQRLKDMQENGRSLTHKSDPNHIEYIENMENPDLEVINVPISLTLVVIAAYVFVGAVLFASWNGWSMIKGAYFTFITLSTIGFGDVVPGFDDSDDLKIIASILFILIGLAVLSMSFNLMMEEMFSKFTWLGTKIGIVKPEQDPKINDDKKPLINKEKLGDYPEQRPDQRPDYYPDQNLNQRPEYYLDQRPNQV